MTEVGSKIKQDKNQGHWFHEKIKKIKYQYTNWKEKTYCTRKFGFFKSFYSKMFKILTIICLWTILENWYKFYAVSSRRICCFYHLCGEIAQGVKWLTPCLKTWAQSWDPYGWRGLTYAICLLSQSSSGLNFKSY